jgi:hypothetical protein
MLDRVFGRAAAGADAGFATLFGNLFFSPHLSIVSICNSRSLPGISFNQSRRHFLQSITSDICAFFRPNGSGKRRCNYQALPDNRVSVPGAHRYGVVR